MNITLLEKINKLPVDKQQTVADFIEFLHNEYVVKNKESVVELRGENIARPKSPDWVDSNDTP